MKKITRFSTLLMLTCSLNAMAQSSTTANEGDALAEIAAVSGLSSPTSIDSWDGLVYEVQILALRQALPEGDTYLKDLEHVRSYEHDNWTKYTWGRTRLFHEAERLQREMYRNGFQDAFVVAYNNGKRISSEEAEALRK